MRKFNFSKGKKHPQDVAFQHKTRLPGFQIIRHPRYFNEPLSCRSGIHKGLINRIINGVASLYCTKCSATIGEGLYNKTWTKQEIHKIKLIQREAQQPKGNKQSLKDSWEALELLRTKFTDKQIAKMMKRRRHGLWPKS